MDRLSLRTLARLAPEQRPRVDPRELKPRILHFGLGAFHRAHQADYTEETAARSGDGRGIVAVVPRQAGLADQAAAQDGLFSLTTLAADARPARVVGSVVETLDMQRRGGAVDALMAAPELATVTITVTEKGYARRPRGGLDRSAPGIEQDLAATAGGGPMTTVVGRLASGLLERFRGSGAAIDLVSCDNTADNGAALRGVLGDFVRASSWPERDALLEWFDSSVGCPDTVVDRIVPATTSADLDAASNALGLRDDLAVVGEPYRQWVLEDAFRGDRPQWELAGALFVDDVRPYQQTKLRLLNGAHSALAYLGLAAGRATVADVMATDWGDRLVRSLGDEVGPTIAGGPDKEEYAQALVTRFANPAVRHRLQQIGNDGSLKVGERWLPALRQLRTAGASTTTLELALAAWVNATRPSADSSSPRGSAALRFGTTDPAAAALAACWGAGDLTTVVARLLRTIGADDVAEDPAIVDAITSRLPALAAGRIEI